MNNLRRKISLTQQIVISSSIIFVILLGLYYVYLGLIYKTNFYSEHSTIANVLFWSIGIILAMVGNVFVLNALTKPLSEFIGYLKDFENINFKEVEKHLTNSDFIRLSEALDLLQESLDNTINELREKNKEITILNEQQKKDLTYKRNLVSSISHDLKTPLTVIHTTLSAIRDGIFSEEEIPAELDNLILEIEKTTNMLKSTINVYKLESDSYKMTLEPLSLIALINEICTTLAKLFQKQEQTLNTNFPNDVILHADKEQMTRAITNLVMNAIVHSPNGNTVTINIVSNSRNDILEIINTGVNIPEDDIVNIFEAFYRGDKARTEVLDSGNGLGLYSSREILVRHGYELGVVNLDNAVKFYVVFPKKKKQF